MVQPKSDAASIAITGLACRMPGGGGNVDSFWDSICNGKSAWSPIPRDRFHADAFTGNTAKGAHFLQEDISLFDAKFFNVSRDEARAMDPQQRLMLEVVYEALEAAGYPLSEIAGTRTGVYMGQFTDDYKELVSHDAETSLPYSMTGLQRASLSNRISWLFDLRGPSFTVATACSSSLVALHLACQSLQNKEAEMAIVGGCNLIINPNMFIFQSGQGFLSPDGKCKTFDAAADGYGRGEGFAVVVLKRVDDAVNHRDPIRAVIRGTGSNQDGHTKGFTLPSADAQASLIHDVYRRAGLDFSLTSYVEAHGTGTKAGDLEETTALSRTIAAGLGTGRNLIVGSVKSNIGHLEAGAGLAAVVKSVLMLEKGVIPPNINLNSLNPALKLDEWKMQVPTAVMPWPTEGLRRISVNSFGYGGSNAHAILDDAQSYLAERGYHGVAQQTVTGTANGVNGHGANGHETNGTSASQTASSLLFPISAQDKGGIARVMDALKTYLVNKGKKRLPPHKEHHFLHDLAFTLTTRRSHHQWKTFCTASSPDELLSSLSSPSPPPPPILSSHPPSLTLIFTGQGAQYPLMGHHLLTTNPTFRASILAADAYLQTHLGSPWSVATELAKPKSASRVRTAQLAQPLCTILQVALVDLLRAWGVLCRPAAVVGHSSGEMAAAYCAGALTREEAWRVAYYRGVAAARLAGGTSKREGAMMAVGAGPEVVGGWIRECGLSGGVWVACENAPESVTVSGDGEAVERLEGVLREKGVFARRLRVDVAYHSPHMQAVAREYLEAIADVAPGGDKGKKSRGGFDSGCVMYSSVTGQKVGDPSELGAAYWVRNLISPVKFSTAVRYLAGRKGAAGGQVFVEVGPHPALQGPTTQTLQAAGMVDVQYRSVLRRDRDAQETALELAGSLFARGYPVDFRAVNQTPERPRTLVDLPAYPWDHSRSHWAESRVAKEYRLREPLPNSLLGAASPVLVAGEHVWRGHLSLAKEPWIADHKIHGAILFPAAGFIAMAAEAALFKADAGREVSKFRLRDIHLTTPLVLAESSPTEYTVCLRPHLSANKATSSEWMEFSVSSSPDGKALERNCIGLITLEYRSTSEKRQPQDKDTKAVDAHQQAWERRLNQASELCKSPVGVEQFYQRMASAGLQYGPAFKNLTQVCTAPSRSCGSVSVPEVGLGTGSRKPLVVHPATLDAVIHMAFAAVIHGSAKAMKAMVPKSIDEVVIATDFPNEPRAQISGCSTVSRHGYSEILADMTMQEDVRGQPVLKIAGLCCAELAGARVDDSSADTARSICSKLVWRPALGLLRQEELKTFLQRAVATDTAVSYYPQARATAMLTVYQLIKLIHHSKPDASIVEFVNGIGNSQPLRPTLNITDALKTASYTIYVPDEPTQQAVATHLQPLTDVGIEVRDMSRALADGEGGSNLDTFDLVIIPAPDALRETAVLENAMKLVASDGRLCVVAPVEQADDIEARGRAAGVQDWFRLELDDSEKRLSVLLGQRRRETAVNGVGHSPEVVILQSPDPSAAAADLAGSLMARLTSRGYPTSSRTWGACDAAAFEGKACISLVEIDRPILQHLPENGFSFVQGLILRAQRVLWIGAPPETAPGSAIVTGLARVVRSEEPGIVFHTLNLNLPSKEEMSVELEKICSLVVRTFQDSGGENEFRIRNGVIEVSRVVEDDELNADLLESLGLNRAETTTVKQVPLEDAGGPLKLCVRNAGLLDSLCFEPDTLPSTALADDEVEIEVKATSLNFRDVMTAMGQLPTTELGFDAAGIILRTGPSASALFHPGDRVAMCMPGAHRTIHRAKAALVQPIPASLTFADAATLPLAHGTAWYALIHLARARRGQSVLIHAAAGGVGQAALQIAQHLGLEIFATVGSDPKRRLLREVYGVRDDHIFSSRDSREFAQGVKGMTPGGRGVDVVLNSLPGEALRQSWYCVAPFGTFVEIGVRDILDNARLEMRPFLEGGTFTFFDLRRVMLERPGVMGEIMQGVFGLLREGVVRPVSPVAVFPAGEVESAFRLMQGGQHVGKIVLSFEDGKQMVPLWQQSTANRPSVKLDPDAAYLLAGGLGGLGRSLSGMLVDHGARRLCFLSRSADATERPAVRDLVRQLQDRGVQVLILPCDVADEMAVRQAVSQCTERLGRVAGVIQCAMVLRDALFRNMTYADWAESTRPKVHGTWNLHTALPDVDFFINLASFTAIFGSRGVANYAAGSTFQDAVAHFRQAEGKHAVTLDVSVVRDAGVLAETGMTQGLKELAGLYGLDTHEVAELVWLAISGDVANQSPAQIVTGIATGGSAVAGGFEAPWYLDDPKFAVMARTGLKGSTKTAQAAAVDDVPARLSRAKTLDEAARVVTEALVDRVAKMLQTTAGEIDTGRYLHSYGIDSLVAIETVNWALKVCAARVTVFDIMAAVPITATARKIAASSSATPKEVLEAAD
ncbi:PKS01 highly reducing polyketide synthase [Parachaetomium inaequale]|uniref:PKS01 highly reducing polyketide synthase n=1 Tax=Parachaetomium inaequale TaxID=2588326 RepID=A0AAN6PLB7_9PEZI|nr:PKS01 highly reducing polyketide synthase [Parachaetomium inaequale]